MARSRNKKHSVTIYPAWCKGCGMCVAFCPEKVFKMGPTGKATVVDEDACINCGFCELHCPDFAIKLSPREEDDSSGARHEESSTDEDTTS